MTHAVHDHSHAAHEGHSGRPAGGRPAVAVDPAARPRDSQFLSEPSASELSREIREYRNRAHALDLPEAAAS